MSKKVVYGFTAIALAFFVVGCQSSPESRFSAGAPIAPEEAIMVEGELVVDEGGYASPAPGSGAANYSGIERLIIRNGSLSIVVADTQAALDKLDDLVSGLGGYVVESNLFQYQEGLQASATLRVPAESFDLALESIRELATEVLYENISGQDMTEEYVDLQSRLRYLEATEERLLQFMEEAEDTEAAMAVYKQLQEIQADMEHVKGRIQYLEQSAAMATISIEITPDELAQPIQVGGWHPEGTLRDAFQSLIHVLQSLADALIVFVVLILPVLIAIAIPCVVLFFFMRAVVRRWRGRKRKQA